MTGVEKFAGTLSADAPVVIDGSPNSYGLLAGETTKMYGLPHYHGIPEALYKQLEGEPLLPGFLLKAYDVTMGPLLILLGITLLLGIATRISLFALSLLYTSLTYGLILLGQDGGIAWLGIHIALIALAVIGTQYWPLPWYLRTSGPGGYWSELPSDARLRPIRLLMPSPSESEVRPLESTHTLIPHGLRDNAPMLIAIRNDVWNTYLQQTP